MDKLIKNIISYLNYLNGECNLKVSVHFKEDIFLRIPKSIFLLLAPYNCHTNAYCVLVKNTYHHKCLLNQKNLIAKCQNGSPFCYNCHAAVYEYIYPIFKGEAAVGFIAVSDYRHNSVEKDNILNYDLWKSVLKQKIPIELCETVIPPLCIMLEKMMEMCLQEFCSEYNLVLNYLNEYHSNITLSELAKNMSRSKSHISHLFKKENGMTIRAYCNKLKLEDARKLLISTDLPITAIALDVGFNDTSYFIHLFKNQFGVSPLQYRKLSLSAK